jgi:hydrogenase expression/formation protein HypC
VCVGTPLRIRALSRGDLALCVDRRGEPYALPVQTALLDHPPAAGDWLLVHIDTAIRALDAGEAQQIGDALEALDRAARGEDFEHLIADLVDREPQLPPHLRPAATDAGER